jgi:hypothetical protein
MMSASRSSLALDEPERSPREIAVAFTDRERTYVSEASVYRLLRAEGLITSPAFMVMKAAERFANPTKRRDNSRRWLTSTRSLTRNFPDLRQPRDFALAVSTPHFPICVFECLQTGDLFVFY